MDVDRIFLAPAIGPELRHRFAVMLTEMEESMPFPLPPLFGVTLSAPLSVAGKLRETILASINAKQMENTAIVTFSSWRQYLVGTGFVVIWYPLDPSAFLMLQQLEQEGTHEHLLSEMYRNWERHHLHSVLFGNTKQ